MAFGTSNFRARSRRWPLTLIALVLSSTLAGVVGAQAPAAAPNVDSWRARYEHARATLLSERYHEAEVEFRNLEDSAATPEDRALARELASIASAQVERHSGADQPALRTTDELTVLYTTAVLYGLGTSGWLSLQLRPSNFGAAILPFAVITPASVGIVALADSYRPLRHGIPHAIAAGLYLGLGEGLWIVTYQNAYAHRSGSARWRAERASTALWATTTVGAVVGGLVGAWRRPTPGRVSFTASTAIWGGLMSAFASTGLDSDDRKRSERAHIVGIVGYNLGVVAGLLFGPSAAPSVARVRFTDLGGLFGALAAGGGYALVAKHRDSRAALGAAAIGGTLGLGVTWWATSGMAPDRSHDALRPALGKNASVSESGLSALQTSLTPVPGGVMLGVGGRL